jgi:hypothetical protein
MDSLFKRSPVPGTPWQHSVIHPRLRLHPISRSLHQHLHSSSKIRIPTHPNNRLTFSAHCPISTDYHPGIGWNPYYLQLYCGSSFRYWLPSLPLSFCLGCYCRCLRCQFFISPLALFGFCTCRCHYSSLSLFRLAPLSPHCFENFSRPGTERKTDREKLPQSLHGSLETGLWGSLRIFSKTHAPSGHSMHGG